MNYADAHDDHTRNATIRQVIEYLNNLMSSDDPHILRAMVYWTANDIAYDLEIALEELDALRNALARIDARNTND